MLNVQLHESFVFIDCRVTLLIKKVLELLGELLTLSSKLFDLIILCYFFIKNKLKANVMDGFLVKGPKSQEVAINLYIFKATFSPEKV